MTTDDRLRDAYGRAIEARAVAARARCVSPEALLALVRREGREVERLATLDHAMNCAACREEFELLRSIERAGGDDVRQAVEGIRWKRNLSMAIAASAILAIGIGTGRQVLDPDDGDIMRSGASDEIGLVAPAVSASLRAGGAVTFTWRSVPGAPSYVLELLDADGEVAWTGLTRDTTLSMPIADLLPPGAYHWTVRARSEDGRELRSVARPMRVTD